MLILGTRKSLIAEPCCGGCAKGKPCCGNKEPLFVKRGVLWLPDNRVRFVKKKLPMLDLPQWPRDRDFLLKVEKLMPLKFVSRKYGDPLRWKRQLQTVRNLVTLPPDQWGGLVRWDLPAYMPSYDLSCTGCCVSDCCCELYPNYPTPLFVTITAAGGVCADCHGSNNLMTDQSMPLNLQEDCDVAHVQYQENGDFFCTCDHIDLECTSQPPDGEWLFQIGGGFDLIDVTMTLVSCNPMQLTGSRVAVLGEFGEDICDFTVGGETFQVFINE